MNKIKIAAVTIAMTTVAGFSEATTFVAGNHTFSVHVLANLILEVAAAIDGRPEHSWLRLITLPVFVAAIFMGYYLIHRKAAKQNILLIEGIILTMAGLLPMVSENPQLIILATNMVVIAMGLQTCYMWSYPNDCYARGAGILGHLAWLIISFNNSAQSERMSILKALFYQYCLAIAGFAIGGLLGAFLSKSFGLICLLVPGIIMINGYIIGNARQND